MMIVSFLKYLWVLPNTLLGLFLLPFALFSRDGRLTVHQGVLELEGAGIRWLLTQGTPFAGGALAVTLGHVVIGQNAAALDRCREHERVHVRQYEKWGPAFLPAYFLASLFVWLQGKDPYRDNPFEKEAFNQSAGSANSCSAS